MTLLLHFALLLGTFSASAAAHGYITNFWSPTKHEYGECVRPYVLYQEKNPITDRYSDEMTCGRLPGAASFPDKTCSVAKAGDKVGLQWSIMDGGHLGPVLVYMASTESKGEGEAWWKIYYDGYNAEKDYWATSKLWDNNGILWISLPNYLPAGDYIIRGEIIALHNASYIDGAQIYVNCVHIKIEESAEAATTIDVNTIPKVAFPGYYTYDTPGLHLNIWWPPPVGYPEVGPPVYTPDAASESAASASVTSSAGSTSASSDIKIVQPNSAASVTIAYQATSPTLFYQPMTSATPLFLSETSSDETPSSELQSRSAIAAAVFPDLSCSTSGSLTSTLSTLLENLASTTATATASSATVAAVFPDLTCTASSKPVSTPTTLLTAVVAQTQSQHIATLTVTPNPVTVHATVTVSIYETEYVIGIVTVTRVNIAY
ncbi:glycosyl hydrolase family 61-domain-containing protein [Lipomyces tetrasporus]|uniref:AA9 family lytic polysaccharide monooxygenase n=1 Tax=Lipomyces tetrasporus TaxID=54092 RepID=A0AAD7QZJ9_9ASCO|nr:glycosyl hydrolase family 61-domain-containing protein [Lipomyces tetrasporus]KAJ8104280.1 glycosyl hydrolase family 61-domain-containing protein [Lipomyces tetrasporus]